MITTVLYPGRPLSTQRRCVKICLKIMKLIRKIKICVQANLRNQLSMALYGYNAVSSPEPFHFNISKNEATFSMIISPNM